MNTTLISSVTDIESGLEARITELKSGKYSVTLKDTDAACVLPTARIFKDYEPALAYARTLTN